MEEVYAERFREERDKAVCDLVEMEQAKDAAVQHAHDEALWNAAALSQAHSERKEVTQHQIQGLALE